MWRSVVGATSNLHLFPVQLGELDSKERLVNNTKRLDQGLL